VVWETSARAWGRLEARPGSTEELRLSASQEQREAVWTASEPPRYSPSREVVLPPLAEPFAAKCPARRLSKAEEQGGQVAEVVKGPPKAALRDAERRA
jgi:hypothetical protein